MPITRTGPQPVQMRGTVPRTNQSIGIVANSGGGILTADFGTAVSQANVENYTIRTRYGRNSNIGTGSPADVWEGGGSYTGFNATANENISVASTNAADVGTTVTSGVATGGSATTLVDTGKDFVALGVVVGDIVVNTTKSGNGLVLSVATTVLTVFQMEGVIGDLPIINGAGDAYFVARPSSTGAALVRLDNLLDATFAQQTARYAVLNGVTPVSVTGSYMRCSACRVIKAGSGGSNAGMITANQAVTTANVFISFPAGTNQAQVCADTVPLGKKVLIKRIAASIARSGGTPGSANVTLRIRRRGEVFRATRNFELQTGGPRQVEMVGAEVLLQGTDFKMRVDSVSDNNTIAGAALEYYTVPADIV